MKTITLFLVLLLSTAPQAQAYRDLNLNTANFQESDGCEFALKDLTDLVSYFSNNGDSLVFSGTCSFKTDPYWHYALNSNIKTTLKPGIYSLGSYCMPDWITKIHRRTMAILSNEKVQLFIADSSATQECASTATVKIKIE